MSNTIYRLAEPAEQQQVLDFINEHFDWRLPLVNRPEWFAHYYTQPDKLQFAIAEEDGQWLSVAGYILANQSEAPDIWVSVWVAVKGHNGVGLELMNALPQLVGARVVACNNIRKKTCNFYRFLGWSAERMPHYYRLADKSAYSLAKISQKVILPVSGDLTLTEVSEAELELLGLPESDHTPAKDLWYLKRRYFHFPHLTYHVWAAKEGSSLLAYLVTRTVSSGEQGEIPVVRIVDFLGKDKVLPRLGKALDGLISASGAEYLDCYNVGIPAEVWAAAGLNERVEKDANIIPNYLTPPLYENTDYYYFTNLPEGFTMFKADGDQDRPNLGCDN